MMTSSLFRTRQSPEKMLEELKRGTLFNFGHKIQPSYKMQHSRLRKEETKLWLEQIKLGMEEESSSFQNILCFNKKSEKSINNLPNITKWAVNISKNPKQQKK